MTSTKPDLGPRFTGGDNLKGFERLAHEAMMKNELSDGYGAYKLAHASGDKSGYSFGGNQMDLSKDVNARTIFMDIMKDAKDERGNLIFDKERSLKDQADLEKIKKGLTSTGADRPLDPYKAKIDQALASPEGRAKIDAVYPDELRKKINTVDQRIASIPDKDVQAAAKKDDVRLRLVDYHNQLNISNNGPMHRYLQGKEVVVNSEIKPTRVKMEGTLDKDDIDRFSQATKYGYQQQQLVSKGLKDQSDVIRRQENVDTVLNDPKLAVHRTAEPSIAAQQPMKQLESAGLEH